ncbi:MAG: hypothetical protein HUJ98_05265 [Bacteroidaceae bacterium]|nr:hypothetical protein [Bacteroidaceae bacterium]
MTEPEVSLLIALFYIKNHKTSEVVKVSIDGAHVKIGNTILFDIRKFLSEHNLMKMDSDATHWQGFYKLDGYEATLEISSVPGVGDVNVRLNDGSMYYIESKKGKAGNKANQEYALMREAIGQLMTADLDDPNIIPVVAVPWTEKSFELANRWSKLKQIKAAGIHFMLVKENEEVEYI